jgi:hypothetical protein
VSDVGRVEPRTDDLIKETITMKVRLPLGILLLLAAAVGYLLGTESGRQQRDRLIAIIRREEAIDELIEAIDDTVTEGAAQND